MNRVLSLRCFAGLLGAWALVGTVACGSSSSSHQGSSASAVQAGDNPSSGSPCYYNGKPYDDGARTGMMVCTDGKWVLTAARDCTASDGTMVSDGTVSADNTEVCMDGTWQPIQQDPSSGDCDYHGVWIANGTTSDDGSTTCVDGALQPN